MGGAACMGPGDLGWSHAQSQGCEVATCFLSAVCDTAADTSYADMPSQPHYIS